MSEEYRELPWEEPDWLQRATEWVHRELLAGGSRPTGDLEILHQRPWATFAQIATDKGKVYFKAPAPPYFEAPLTDALTRWRPDCTVDLLATDLERGWLLSADSGITLRSASPGADQVEHWLKLLSIYVEFQIQMAEHVPALLAFGMFDRRLAKLPGLYAQLLENRGDLRIGLVDGLSQSEVERLQNLQPQVVEMCEQLAAYEFAETLTHEEVHDANVLVADERYVFTDWSDASVSHPFFSILVTLRAAAHRLKLDEDGPQMVRVRDAYLEPWTKFETRKNVMDAFEIAYRLAMVNRALSWHQGMHGLARKHKDPYADFVPGWLQDFLEAM